MQVQLKDRVIRKDLFMFVCFMFIHVCFLFMFVFYFFLGLLSSKHLGPLHSVAFVSFLPWHVTGIPTHWPFSQVSLNVLKFNFIYACLIQFVCLFVFNYHLNPSSQVNPSGKFVIWHNPFVSLQTLELHVLFEQT